MDDMTAMAMLHGLAMHSMVSVNLGSLLEEICEIAISLSGADFGNVQLVDPATSELSIAVQRGFPSWWIDYWNAAAKNHGVCGSALEAGERVIVEDVASSPLFLGKPSLKVQLDADVRAVQSTPLLTRAGNAVGIFSTHFRQPHRPRQQVLRWLDLLARQAADLIENARVGAALRDSELRLRALVTATSDVIYCMSPDWSRMRFLQGKGFISDTPQACDDWLSRYIDAEDQPRVLAAIRNAVRTTTPFDLEHRVRRVDGSLGWTHSRAVPVLGADGEIVEWFGAASDITASKQVAAQLLEQQQRLAALLESLPVGVAFTNSPDCELVMGNRALLEQLGAGRDDNVSASAKDAQAYGPRILYWREGEPVADKDLPLQRAAREGRTIGPVELLVRLPSGKEFYIESRGAPIRDNHGNLLGAVTVTSDVTERKQALAIREHARLQEEFMSMLGHELRNPLAALSGAIDLLSSGAGPGRQETMETVVRTQVAVLKRLVDDLLDVSRISMGCLRLQREDVSLRELLTAAGAAARPTAALRSHELSLTLPARDVHFLADKVRLLQILANLLDNACKYSGPASRIELLGALEGADIVLRCRDNGRGIEQHAQGRIFDPLVRLAQARRDAPGGLGIGLALVQRLAELHKGSVAVRSAGLNAGSEFIVKIPYEAAKKPAEPAGASFKEANPSMLRVAIVEDDPDVSRVLELAVQRAGHQAHPFADAPSALARIPALLPQVVLLDVNLPGMNGHELLAKLRGRLGLRDTLFIGISGLGPSPGHAAETDEAASFDFFLRKPFDMHELSALLQRQRTLVD